MLARHGGEEITRGILTHIGSAGEQRGGGGGSLPGGDGHLANVQVYLVPSDQRALTAAEIELALGGFRGLPHRMEEVGKIGRVEFINDSKATNVDAAFKSITIGFS